MVVTIVLGTRPEIIKLAPLMRALREASVGFEILHTGQHYSDELDAVFFRELGLVSPSENLRVGSGTGAAQTGEMISRLDAAMAKRAASAVVVLGDTNSVLAGAIVATKRHIPLVHVEAGLRSRDRWMPEEINRILTDHASDLLLAPTEGARANLRSEGLPEDRIHVVGNTVVDAVLQHLEIARSRPKPPSQPAGKYAVATIHRAENLEFPQRFAGILDGLRTFSKRSGLAIVYPMHPHAKRRALEQGQVLDGLQVVAPLGYLDFLRLQAEASVLITDSGGIQEESCVLQVPCVTVRDNTERPETIEVGANVLAGADPKRIVEAATAALGRARSWRNPFGDGSSARRIVELLQAKGLTHPRPAAA